MLAALLENVLKGKETSDVNLRSYMNNEAFAMAADSVKE